MSGDGVAMGERLALVFTPASHRPAMAAYETVLAEIGDSLAPGLDHHVAHTRLVWWREEIGRMLRGTALHPAGQLLQQIAPTARFARLESLITAAEFQLAGHEPRDPTELTALIDRLHAAPEILRAEILHGGPDERLVAFGQSLGRAFGYAACLVTAPDADRSRYYALCRDALRALAPQAALAAAERHGLVRAALLARRLTPTGLSAPPSAWASLFTAWRSARRLRLEIV